MTTEVIEGQATEVEPRALTVVVAQPGNALVSRPDAGPATMIAQATALASALRDIVERQKLYATISGKKFPQVEAWMTIGRMDNVVAREAEIIRHEDGSYEAAAELVRLSDGMVIGRGSALCGTKGDRPWDGRPEPVRRSMAVTRATSRAFRQQYSWIMALAGYEPTPADEMPIPDVSPRREDAPRRESFGEPDYGDEPGATERRTTHRDGLIGKAIAQGTQDFELRQTPDGPALPFRVKEGRLSQIALATGPIALALAASKDEVLGQRVTVWGYYTDEEYFDKKKDQLITYKVLHVERIKTPEWELPGDLTGDNPQPAEAPSEPLPFDMAAVDAEKIDPEERAMIGGGLPG